MTIRAFIAEMRPGDPPILIPFKYQVDYVRDLANQLGVILMQRKQVGGYWELIRIPGRKEWVFYCFRFRKRQRARQRQRRLDPERKFAEKLMRVRSPESLYSCGSPGGPP